MINGLNSLINRGPVFPKPLKPSPTQQMSITIPKIAFERLAQSVNDVQRPQMTCKTPKFPEIVLEEYERGIKCFKNEKLYLIAFPESKHSPAMLQYGFYGGDMSNFSGIDAVGVYCDDKIRQTLLNLRFDCGEQYFKLMCALLHVDATGKNLEVVDAVLDAVEPKKAKFATFKIKDFDREDWDEVSPDAMYFTQMHKMRCPTIRNRMIEVARIAKGHGVLPMHVFFTENTTEELGIAAVPATETTPAIEGKKGQKADLIWGIGKGVDEFFKIATAEGNVGHLHESLADPENRRGRTNRLFAGKNGLGVAIDQAFLQVVGTNYEFVDETMDEFVRRIMAVKGFDYLQYAPDAPVDAPADAPTDTPAMESMEEERPVTPLTFTENAELVESFVTPKDKIISTLEEPPAKRSRSDNISDDENIENIENVGEADAPLSRSMSCARTLSDQY